MLDELLRRADEMYSAFAHVDRARREAVTGVQRFVEVDGLPGHRDEMVSRMRRLKDAVDLGLAIVEQRANVETLDDALAAWTEAES